MEFIVPLQHYADFSAADEVFKVKAMAYFGLEASMNKDSRPTTVVQFKNTKEVSEAEMVHSQPCRARETWTWNDKSLRINRLDTCDCVYSDQDK
jgi:hypothetical protein